MAQPKELGLLEIMADLVPDGNAVKLLSPVLQDADVDRKTDEMKPTIKVPQPRRDPYFDLL